MPVRKLREMKGSCGLTLPIDDLRRDGIVDENDDVQDQYFAVDRVGEGEFKISRVDSDGFE